MARVTDIARRAARLAIANGVSECDIEAAGRIVANKDSEDERARLLGRPELQAAYCSLATFSAALLECATSGAATTLLELEAAQ